MPTLKTRSTTRSEPDVKNLALRLQTCRDRGKLTIADLAALLGRPFHTVRCWLNGFTLPGGPRAASIWPKLSWIEKMIRERKGLPVPDDVGHFDRPEYIKRLLHGRTRFSGLGAAKRRRRAKVRVRKARRKGRA